MRSGSPCVGGEMDSTPVCGRKSAVGRRNRGDEGVAGTTLGVVQAGASEGGLGESDLYGPKCVLGAQPADWRAGRSAVVHGTGGDLVRTEEGGRDAAVAWAKETPGGLSPHHRLVGEKAGGVGELSLPGRVVSDEPISHGV